MKKKLITRICVCAILAALYFVFDLISIKAGPFKLSVSGLPIILVAIIYGPIDAMIVGFTGAFLGQLLSYGFTPTTILWCLPALVRGLFVGLFTKKLNVKEEPIKLIIIIIISSLLVTTINTVVMYIDSKLYNYYSYAYIFGALLYRYIAGILTAIIYSVLTPIIYEPVSKILNIKKASKNEGQTDSNEKLKVVFNNLSIILGIISIVTCFKPYLSILFGCLGIICVFITKQVKNNKGFKYSLYGIIFTLSILLLKFIIECIADGIIQIILNVLSSLF